MLVRDRRHASLSAYQDASWVQRRLAVANRSDFDARGALSMIEQLKDQTLLRACGDG